MNNITLKAPACLFDRVKAHLEIIYPGQDADALTRKAIAFFEPIHETLDDGCVSAIPLWSEKDIALLTYGNSLVEEETLPLETLDRFLKKYTQDRFSIVHILPFFPYSSDDGFAVMDYYTVNPSLGDWKDIRKIAGHCRLMADLVVNHTSSRSRWFENFKKSIHPGKDYYVTVDPQSDLSQVIRPRTTPLVREVATPDGPRHVWCTFGHDQVDLNFKNPDVLMEFLAIIRHYLDNGVEVFRLDAVAFLWKEVCTTCLHLGQTHKIVKLMRTLIQAHNPRAIIITETNVPARENISYFGIGDEAQIIYNFPLPPFLLNTMITGNSKGITDWLKTMPDTMESTTCLNFIASHDGIGLRPVEDYFSRQEMTQLIDLMKAFGGKISTRALNDHKDNPYEINISLWDAMKGTIHCRETNFQIERFICAHTIMLGLKGIPAIYIHSLLGTENDYERRENLQSNRAVNRHIWNYPDLCEKLADPDAHHHQVFSTLCALVDKRKQQQAFHPDAGQTTFNINRKIVAFQRRPDKESNAPALFCIHNITNQAVTIPPNDLPEPWRQAGGVDLISENPVQLDTDLNLTPYQSMWIKKTATPKS
ncbi:sugar phosphorylase [uncultured Desulfobacter sp.]|uniref:sugar phosphorylase n=1 Tax=uncultured Desulfobacter sp. TaxID=240139 RepID=UPI0029F4A7EF|nr:sugar phosphorylase [uncultured Desulfobacter sp.]